MLLQQIFIYKKIKIKRLFDGNHLIVDKIVNRSLNYKLYSVL